MRRAAIFAAAVLAGVLAVPASAHHSFAMFDVEMLVELKGTVKEFQWSNPHSWLVVVVADKGKTKDWTLEMASPSKLVQDGWTPKTVVPGDKVAIRLHPLKGGAPGGLLVSVVLPGGKKSELIRE